MCIIMCNAHNHALPPQGTTRVLAGCPRKCERFQRRVTHAEPSEVPWPAVSSSRIPPRANLTCSTQLHLLLTSPSLGTAMVHVEALLHTCACTLQAHVPWHV